MHWMWDGHWAWMLLWWVFILAIVVGIVVGVVALVRRPSGPTEESPEQILKRRYARGEIDRDTYQRALQELRK